MSESNGFADRNTFLAATAQRRYGEFVLPVSGVKVRFQSMDAAESAAFDGEEYDFDTETGRRVWNREKVEQTPARLIVACLVNGQGDRLLNQNDIPQVLKMDAADIEALGWAIRVHCRLLDRAEAKKNSPQDSNTTTASA